VEQGQAVIHSGYTGSTLGSAPMPIRGTGGLTQVTLPQGWVGKIRRGRNDIQLVPDDGSPAYISTPATLPTFDIAVAFNAQSWGDQASDFPAAMAAEFKRMGLPASAMSIRFSAAGGSGLWRRGQAGKQTQQERDNYWLDETANGGAGALGPMALKFVQAVQAAMASPQFPRTAGVPDLSKLHVLVLYGLPDLTALDPAVSGWTSYYTTSQWAADQKKLQDLLRAALGSTEIRFYIMPIPSQDPGVWKETLYGALRRAQPGVAALDGTGVNQKTFRAGDATDLLRPFDNRHHYFRGRARLMARFARAIAKASLNKPDEWFGPKIIPGSFTRLATNSFRFQVSLEGGSALNQDVMHEGFGIALGSNPEAARLPIAPAGFDWSFDSNTQTWTCIVTTTGDDGTTPPEFYYPDGSAPWFQSPSRTVYAYGPDASPGRAGLQTYNPVV
jgi:hypothetical protein